MRKNERMLPWLLVLAYTSLIYSSLYIVRVISLSLRKHNLLSPAVLLIYAAVVLLLAMAYRRAIKVATLRSLIPLFFVFSVVFFLFRNIAYTDKKVHLIEYGFMGFLVWRACLPHAVRLRDAYFSAFLLTGVIGIVDELIELFVPLRFCSAGDMIMNTVSGALGLCLVAIFTRNWEARSFPAKIVLVLSGVIILYIAVTQNHLDFFRKYLS